MRESVLSCALLNKSNVSILYYEFYDDFKEAYPNLTTELPFILHQKLITMLIHKYTPALKLVSPHDTESIKNIRSRDFYRFDDLIKADDVSYRNNTTTIIDSPAEPGLH